MTAAGWAPYGTRTEPYQATRTRVRRELGIPEDAIVFGIAGSLAWSSRFEYCYGRELVEAFRRARAPHLRILIVGDGPGKDHLERLAGDALGKEVILTGRVPRERVPDYLDAMDIGSLPQSVDGVGSFPYTTKISDYLARQLPIVTTSIPASYDLDYGCLWRLPGSAPWDDRFIQALTDLMARITPMEIEEHRSAVSSIPDLFCKADQVARTKLFLSDLLNSFNAGGL
ncbi:MAG: glycosyltransferase [Bryobacteraceae bacterium]